MNVTLDIVFAVEGVSLNIFPFLRKNISVGGVFFTKNCSVSLKKKKSSGGLRLNS